MIATRPRSARDIAAHVLAVWFGCGHVPWAPGTAGTVGAIPLYLLIRAGGPVVVLAVAVLLLFVGVWAASKVAARTGLHDPQIVVIDEVVGVLITLAFAPPSWTGIACGFVLFRVFDQTKPWPARLAENKLGGGWGIVLDDVAAGVWGALAMLALRRLEWL